MLHDMLSKWLRPQPGKGEVRVAVDADSSSPALLDFKVTGVLLKLMGKKFSELVEVFLTTGAQRLGKLREAINAGDAPAVQMNAHSLRGSCGNLGAMAMAQICAELEAAAGQSNLDDIRDGLAVLEQMFEQVKVRLMELVADASSAA
jgi:HPt (histidine-containing phosphotransfer) domain-containing protein